MSFARSRTARDLLSSLCTLVSPPFIYPVCGKTIDLSVIHTHFLSGNSKQTAISVVCMYHMYVCMYKYGYVPSAKKKKEKKRNRKNKTSGWVFILLLYQGDTYSATYITRGLNTKGSLSPATRRSWRNHIRIETPWSNWFQVRNVRISVSPRSTSTSRPLPKLKSQTGQEKKKKALREPNTLPPSPFLPRFTDSLRMGSGGSWRDVELPIYNTYIHTYINTYPALRNPISIDAGLSLKWVALEEKV